MGATRRDAAKYFRQNRQLPPLPLPLPLPLPRPLTTIAAGAIMSKVLPLSLSRYFTAASVRLLCFKYTAENLFCNKYFILVYIYTFMLACVYVCVGARKIFMHYLLAPQSCRFSVNNIPQNTLGMRPTSIPQR